MSVDSDQSAVTSEDSPPVSGLRSMSYDPASSPQEENPQASSPTPQASQKTRGVRPPRGNVSQLLHGAAKKAAHSNSRSDVHEYMRIRRGYV